MAAKNDAELLQTAWTVICAAQKAPTNASVRRRCLEYLAETYREPVKAMIRAWGIRDAHKLEDRLQEYFTKFLEKKWLDQLDRERGRFRHFLRASVRNFLLNEYHKSARRPAHVPLAAETDDSQAPGLRELPADTPTPDEVFNRSWAQQLMHNAVAKFQKRCERHGHTEYFQVFSRHVLNSEEHGSPSYRDTATALEITERDVTNYLYRAKERFTKTVRTLIRETVATDAEVEKEMEDLRQYFG